MTPLLDPPQVADMLKCSVRTVEDHARAGTLPGVRFGDGWVFPTEALLKAVNRMAHSYLPAAAALCDGGHAAHFTR